MTNDLSLTNFINVSLSSTPTGLGNANINSLLLLTTEIPDNLDPYRIYLSPSDVATDYGTDSEAYAMANAVFSQNPNILSGSGRLIVAPFVDAVSATSGDFVTASLTANLAALVAVTDGDLEVTVDGTELNLTGLNFTNCTTLADIAVVLQARLVNTIVSASSTAITILSKKVGADSTIALGAVSGGTGTDLTAAGLLNTAAGTATDGDDSTGETLITAVNRLKDTVEFYPIITNLELEDTALLSAATSIKALDKFFIHSISSFADIAGIATDIKDASLTKTRILLYSNSIDSAKLMRASYASRACSVNFSGSKTISTMQVKSLVGVVADANITQTFLSQAKDAGVDCYASFGGLAKLYTSGENAYFDEVYNDLWLKLGLQVAGFNALAQTSTKLPQTDEGMEILVDAYVKVLEQGVFNGMIGRGLTWNSPEVFGNVADLYRNITGLGYYVYFLPLSSQSQTDREDRKAPLIRIAIKRAGAIHSSDVSVIIER